MSNSPAFQFYPAEYLADENVQVMTLEEEGAYTRAMAYCWREGSIPADPEILARLIGKGCSTTVARVVQLLFKGYSSDKSRLLHLRLEEEREKQASWREKCSFGGKQGAKIKRKLRQHRTLGAGKGSSTNPKRVEQRVLQLNASSSSSSSNNIYTLEFGLEIYALYPFKTKRPAALKAIQGAMKKGYGSDFLRERTDLYSKMVKEANYRYVPNPATWFNQEMFNDDPETWVPYRENGSNNLQLRIDTHPANPEYKKHNPNCAPEEKAEFAALLQKSKEAKRG